MAISLIIRAITIVRAIKKKKNDYIFVYAGNTKWLNGNRYFLIVVYSIFFILNVIKLFFK